MKASFRDWYNKNANSQLEAIIKNYIFPTRDVCIIDRRDFNNILDDHRTRKKSSGMLAFTTDDNCIVMLASVDPEAPPLAMFRVSAEEHPSVDDIKFAHCIAEVFSQDLKWCMHLPAEARNQGWVRLLQTQFSRAMACFLCNKPDVIEHWLRAAENCMNLTYEGKSIHPSIVFNTNPERLNRRLARNYCDFSEPVPVRELFEQKWIRSVVEGQRVALVGDLESKMLTGFMSPSALAPPDEQKEGLYAPHISLRFVQAALGMSGIAMIVSEQGELFVLKGREVVFRKAQGRWHYINYKHIHQILAASVPQDTVIHLLRSAIDLSFEHRGALLCIVDDGTNLVDMVPDHRKRGRANRILRKTLAGLNIKNWQYERQLIIAAAATDGAVILNPDGQVLDVACMIGPCIKRIRALHVKNPSTPGSRSGAAWKASLYGLSLKISTDGPIVGYRAGEQILQIG